MPENDAKCSNKFLYLWLLCFYNSIWEIRLVLLAPAYTPVTPTCSVPPFSIVGWSITRDSTDLQSAHLYPYPTIPLVSLKSMEMWHRSASSCFTAFSIHKPYTKTEILQSQNLLLTLRKLWLHQPCCFSKTVTHSSKWSLKRGADGTGCKNWFSLHQWNECHLIFSMPFPISHKLICESLDSLEVLS